VGTSRIALGVVLALACAGSTHAQQGDPRKATEFIIGNCYRALDDISRVKSAARLLGWQPMTDDMANVLKPVKGTGFQGWVVRDDANVYLVGVNTGERNGSKAQICTVVANLAADVLVPLLLNELSVKKPLGRDEAAMQIEDNYEIEHPTESTVFLRVVRGKTREPAVNITFVRC
jgi:hypothetical protein